MKPSPPCCVLVCALLVACSAGTGNPTPTPPPTAVSDDPFDHPVEPTAQLPVFGQPEFVIPASNIPRPAIADLSNNNVDIIFFEDRLFLAWRTAPQHWASADARIYILSSVDQGRSWEFEQEISLNTDVREPRFMAMDGVLRFYWFEGGTNILGFEPKNMWRVERRGKGDWSERVVWGRGKEVPWSMRVRRGVAYMTSYEGNHYSQSGDSQIAVFFSKSLDGITWEPVNPANPVVYQGGVSEVSFEFDVDGNLWAVTRNEDGDTTGFGSHVCFAPAANLGTWECSTHSNPERYDSPWMFRHGTDLFLVARRDVGGPFDENLPNKTFSEQRQAYLVDYWNRPKRTAFYRLDTQARAVVHVMDLPGVGDTAFPSVRRTGPHSFLMANYTSPLARPDIPWIEAQGSELGTQIYLMEFHFPAQ